MGKLDDPVADAALESRLISLIFEIVRNITATKEDHKDFDKLEQEYKDRAMDRLLREDDYYGSLFYVVAVLAIFCVIFSVLMCLMYHYNKDEKDQIEGKNFIKDFWVSRNVGDDGRLVGVGDSRRSQRKRLYPHRSTKKKDKPTTSTQGQHHHLREL